MKLERDTATHTEKLTVSVLIVNVGCYNTLHRGHNELCYGKPNTAIVSHVKSASCTWIKMTNKTDIKNLTSIFILKSIFKQKLSNFWSV